MYVLHIPSRPSYDDSGDFIQKLYARSETVGAEADEGENIDERTDYEGYDPTRW